MNTARFILTVLLVLGSNAGTFASNKMTAHQLLQVCTTPKAHWVDFCNGFFQAVHDHSASIEEVCAPAGTTRTSLVEIYVMDATVLFQIKPELAGQVSTKIAAEVLATRYPCT